MNLQLENKVAFISGSTSGIGFAVSLALAREGVKVILNGRTANSVQQGIEKLQESVPHAEVTGFPADFANPTEVNNLLSRLPDLDILINNVGIYRAQSFFETSDEDWFQQFEVNVMSGVRLSRHHLPAMLKKNWGRILFVSSECATLVPEELLAYSTSKATLLSLSRGLAQLTKGTSVTVNAVLPGSTLSEGAERFLQDLATKEGKSKAAVEADFFAGNRPSSLLQRFASVEEVANTIAYFCSPLSIATNGSAIKLDGGSMGGIL